MIIDGIYGVTNEDWVTGKYLKRPVKVKHCPDDSEVIGRICINWTKALHQGRASCVHILWDILHIKVTVCKINPCYQTNPPQTKGEKIWGYYLNLDSQSINQEECYISFQDRSHLIPRLSSLYCKWLNKCTANDEIYLTSYIYMIIYIWSYNII